jgi:hypothetical protein
MSKLQDQINAHLYPVLATFSVIYFAVQIIPIAQQAREFNSCVQTLNTYASGRHKAVFIAMVAKYNT